jgi:hypothetical protein
MTGSNALRAPKPRLVLFQNRKNGSKWVVRSVSKVAQLSYTGVGRKRPLRILIADFLKLQFKELNHFFLFYLNTLHNNFSYHFFIPFKYCFK